MSHALRQLGAGARDEDGLVRLLRETADGDEAAFARLYDATSRRLFGLTLRILRDPKSAEEAALDAYWAVWLRAGDYDPRRGAPLAWMLTVARSKSIDLLRARRRRGEKESPARGRAEGLPDHGPSPEAVTATAEGAARLQSALASLPPAQRLAIETAFFGGLSYAEAAAQLQAPLGTMKSRIRLGLQALRRQLAEQA